MFTPRLLKNTRLNLDISAYFAINQWSSIAAAYNLMALFHSSIAINSPLTVFGKLVTLLAFTFMLVGSTEAFDRSFQAIQSLQRKLKKKLATTENKQERREIKCLLLRIDDLRPMNACGYFGVEKSTLTSILSIRYNLLLCG